MLYIVMSSVLGVLYKGTYSLVSPGAMTTPAACMPAPRIMPSRIKEYSTSLRIFSSSLFLTQASSGTGGQFFFGSSSMPKAYFSGSTLPIFTGMCFVIDSTWLSGTPKTRPTSLITARALNLLNVMICDTESWPYFSRTYRITSSRRSS